MFPAAAEPHISGWFHLIYFGVVIPLAAIRHRSKYGVKLKPLPNRVRHFRATSLSLLSLTLLSIVVARLEWITVFPQTIPQLPAILAGLIVYLSMLAFALPRWRRAVEKGDRVVYLFMPSNSSERAWWFVVAVLAGIGEEISWRCVQVALLQGLTSNYWIAALGAAISFAVAHSLQGRRSVIFIAVIALGFQVLVWLTGSLYVAMAVHIAYDITAGLAYGWWGKRLGYAPNSA